MKKLNLAAATCLLSAVFATSITSAAQTLTTLVSFNGANGEDPYFGSLAQDTNGNIYGVTLSGGPGGGQCTNGQGFGCGTIFQITPDGAFSTLYTFCSQENCSDGIIPTGSLAYDSSGNLYGTAQSGGANFNGTVFQITPEGVLTHSLQLLLRNKLR